MGRIAAAKRSPHTRRLRFPPTSGFGRRPDRTAPARPVPAPAKARPQPVVAPSPSTERRYRQTINHVDLWSVLKVSVCFYICSMAVLMVALVALWVIGDATGVISSRRASTRNSGLGTAPNSSVS
jgi:hypothetical protein